MLTLLVYVFINISSYDKYEVMTMRKLARALCAQQQFFPCLNLPR